MNAAYISIYIHYDINFFIKHHSHIPLIDFIKRYMCQKNIFSTPPVYKPHDRL